MKSILQNRKQCYFTECTYDLHVHHVYGGHNRKLSEKYGLKVWLRADLHNMSDRGVHFNKELDQRLKQEAQRVAMNHYGWSIKDFITIFGRNYL